MERVNRILNNPTYREYLKKIEICEVDRIFCRHNMEHFLDVARIAYIMVLEQGLKISKEVVYAIALLHDVGRWIQYEKGIPHEQASAELSKELLDDSGFTAEEKRIILDGIISHRKADDDIINNIIYDSDKLSRKCFTCKASSLCNWSEEEKNLNLTY